MTNLQNIAFLFRLSFTSIFYPANDNVCFIFIQNLTSIRKHIKNNSCSYSYANINTVSPYFSIFIFKSAFNVFKMYALRKLEVTSRKNIEAYINANFKTLPLFQMFQKYTFLSQKCTNLTLSWINFKISNHVYRIKWCLICV